MDHGGSFSCRGEVKTCAKSPAKTEGGEVEEEDAFGACHADEGVVRLSKHLLITSQGGTAIFNLHHITSKIASSRNRPKMSLPSHELKARSDPVHFQPSKSRLPSTNFISRQGRFKRRSSGRRISEGCGKTETTIAGGADYCRVDC